LANLIGKDVIEYANILEFGARNSIFVRLEGNLTGKHEKLAQKAA
jgi:hypothetical protein